MSIYGPNDTSTHESDDCASKEHVDIQVSLRVMKTGDTMTGDSNMGGNLVRGLLTDYPPVDYQGDKVVSGAQTVWLVQDASSEGTAKPGGTEQPMKPIIAIWAEEKGTFSAGEYEFAFVNGSAGGQKGYPMLVHGRVTRMGLTTTPQDKGARVVLVVHGNAADRVVSKSATQAVGILSWGEAYELGPGDYINFRTIWADWDIHSAVVSLLIELDLLPDINKAIGVFLWST